MVITTKFCEFNSAFIVTKDGSLGVAISINSFLPPLSIFEVGNARSVTLCTIGIHLLASTAVAFSTAHMSRRTMIHNEL